MQKNFTVVLPLYNEEVNLLRVLKFLKKIKFVDEIIAINDASTDSTIEILQNFKYKNLKIINLKKNVGKTWGVYRGFKESKNPDVMMFDGDLLGLRMKDMVNLRKRYLEGYDMVILNYGGKSLLGNEIINIFPAVSGVRILNKKDFFKIPFRKEDRFQIENRINYYFIDNNLSIGIVDSPTLRTPHKVEKYHTPYSVILSAKSMKQVLLFDGYIGVGKLLYRWFIMKRFPEKYGKKNNKE